MIRLESLFAMGCALQIFLSVILVTSACFSAKLPDGPKTSKECKDLLSSGTEPLPKIKPVILKPLKKLYDSPDYLYEMKYDGFRGLAYFDKSEGCRFVSRNGLEMPKFKPLCEAISKELKVKNAIFDGEVISPDETGRPIFKQVLRRYGPFQYVAFDLLWLNGKDLRSLPLKTRREKLLKILPTDSQLILETVALVGDGQKMFDLMLEYDLEGIVMKRLSDPYAHYTKWYKYKNRNYSQGFGRRFY